MKNVKKISVLSFCLALLLAGCMTNKEYFQSIGVKEDGNFIAECTFRKSVHNSKTKENEFQYVKQECILNLEKIRNLASYCATKNYLVTKEFNDLMWKNRNSLNKDKLANNFKINYDPEYKKLRDLAFTDDIEIISHIDLDSIDEDATLRYLMQNIDVTAVEAFSLSTLPELLKACDIAFLKRKSPFHQEKKFVDIWE